MLEMLILGFAIIVAYFGYTYKSIIMFVLGIIFMDVVNYIKQKFISRASYVSSQNAYVLDFFVNDSKYTLCIPENQLNEKKKCLALCGSTNCTEYVKQVMGPKFDTFNFDITPHNLGLDKLTLWVDKKRYVYEKTDLIKISEKYERNDDNDDSD